MIGIIALLCLFIGIGIKLSKSKPTVASAAINAWPGRETQPKDEPKDTPPPPPSAPQEPQASPTPTLDPAEKTVEALDKEYQALLEKINRIDTIRKEYREAIGETAELVKSESVAKHYPDVHSAAKDGYIRFSLQTIARRLANIQSLEAPHAALQRAAETLLAERRRVEIDGLLGDLLPDNGPEARSQKLSAAMKQAASMNETVTFDPGLGNPPAIEAVWAQVMSGALVPKPEPGTGDSISGRNLEIIAEVCSGDFSHKNDLTEITPDGARCLKAFGGKDLFLNKLQSLSPESARWLAGWPGEWLSLNGLKDLPEPAARELSRWSGKWLSLNGLQSLDIPAVQHLSKWPGRRLELIGLTAINGWEGAGGELMLSPAMREKIEELKKMKAEGLVAKGVKP